MYPFTLNQIIKGKVAGHFVILGFRRIGGEAYAQVKPVNPADRRQVGQGELALPIDALEPIHA